MQPPGPRLTRSPWICCCSSSASWSPASVSAHVSAAAAAAPGFHTMLFLDFFSMRPTPSSTLVMS
jgi:hypothetical protein